jgi:hypothetical protein
MNTFKVTEELVQNVGAGPVAITEMALLIKPPGAVDQFTKI